jgi:topoisomerase-4 subunit A
MIELPKERMSGMPLDQYAQFALSRYGKEVVTNRAVPDYRDGLKPVHRYILWAALQIGLRSNAVAKKSARVVGDTIGKYHPHGDQAAYGAAVTLANTTPPMIDGTGNFGTPVDSQAGMRYTELRISKYAQLFLLDPNYLEVVPYVANYDGDYEEPLYLPALIPNLLVIGNVLAPAYGVAAGNPEFTLKSVAQITVKALRGQNITVDMLYKTLKVKNSYGSTLTDAEQVLPLITTGKGSLSFCPRIEVDYKAKKIYIKSYGAGFGNEEAVAKKLDKIAEMRLVSNASDGSGKKNKNAGNYGACFTITPVRGAGDEALTEIERDIRKLLTAPERFNLGVTIRKPNLDDTLFKFLNYVQYFKAWASFRIRLEENFTKKQIEKREHKLHIKEGMLIITGSKVNLDKAIQIIREAEDPKAKLISVFKLTDLQAEAVLDTRLRSLAKVDINLLKSDIAQLKVEIKEWQSYLAISGERAAADLIKRVKDYEKNPDKNVRSGLDPIN